jgi:histidinol phosphatase-like PHP family hydrolase
MKLVVITDIHARCGVGDIPARRGELWLPLLRRTVKRINRFIQPDLVAVLGDLVDDGDASEGCLLLGRIKELLDTLECPHVVLPGNHDGDTAQFEQVFGPVPDTIDCRDVRLVTFRDQPAPAFNATRSDADLARAAQAGDGWPGPLVALQHVPVFPPGQTDCPYNLTNAGEAVAALRRGGFTLAVGGHWHPGFALLEAEGLHFAAAPALAEYPFRFMEIDLAAKRPPVATIHQLAVPEGLDLRESHVHTEMAYCASDVNVSDALTLCRALGVSAPAFAEHTGQLYFDDETFWNARFMDKGLATAAGLKDRSDLYFSLLTEAAVPRQCRGLEVDCDFHGRPVLRPGDRERAGFLIGAVHWTAHSARSLNFDQDILAGQHLAAWESFIASGIDVLAHPFRVFHRYRQPPPTSLFEPLAALLARHGVAAELNFHIQEPVPEFVLHCLEKRVKLSFGTDSHELAEVGDFWPHLQFLARLGVARSDLPGILWEP